MCSLRARAAALCRLGFYPDSTYAAPADMPRASAWAKASWRGFLRAGIFILHSPLKCHAGATPAGEVSDRVMREICRFAKRTGGLPRAVSVRPFILWLRDRSGG